jgi:hypothetical protein
VALARGHPVPGTFAVSLILVAAFVGAARAERALFKGGTLYLCAEVKAGHCILCNGSSIPVADGTVTDTDTSCSSALTATSSPGQAGQQTPGAAALSPTPISSAAQKKKVAKKQK